MDRQYKVGDAVAITLLDQSGQEVEFGGQVTQIATSEDGSPSYFVACPFQVGPDHIRLIVPVEELTRHG